MTTSRYDVIIIGTGAGGGTLLHALADTDKDILVLERGETRKGHVVGNRADRPVRKPFRTLAVVFLNERSAHTRTDRVPDPRSL